MQLCRDRRVADRDPLPRRREDRAQDIRVGYATMVCHHRELGRQASRRVGVDFEQRDASVDPGPQVEARVVPALQGSLGPPRNRGLQPVGAMA